MGEQYILVRPSSLFGLQKHKTDFDCISFWGVRATISMANLILVLIGPTSISNRIFSRNLP
jgi:hypothetical protein